jgi:hypothetical protein
MLRYLNLNNHNHLILVQNLIKIILLSFSIIIKGFMRLYCDLFAINIAQHGSQEDPPQFL